MNRDNNNAEYQVSRRIQCRDGSVLLLCSMDGQRYLLNPLTIPDSRPAPAHGLLASPDDNPAGRTAIHLLPDG
jgi:hypothetical protein